MEISCNFNFMLSSKQGKFSQANPKMRKFVVLIKQHDTGISETAPKFKDFYFYTACLSSLFFGATQSQKFVIFLLIFFVNWLAKNANYNIKNNEKTKFGSL